MKSSKFKKYIKTVFCFSPLILFLLMILFYWMSYSKEIIFPDQNISVIPYCDKDNGGASSIHIAENSVSQIQFSYILKSGFINPFAGVILDFIKYRDFTKGQELVFNIRSANSESIKIILLLEIPDYTEKISILSYLHLQKEIPVKPESSVVSVKLSELYVPEWWFEREIREEDSRFQKDFSRVRALLIQSSTNKKSNIQDTIVLNSITLISGNPLIIPVCVSIIILAFLIIFLWFLVQRIKKRLSVQSHAHLNLSSNDSTEQKPSPELLKIIEFIGHNYSNADLKINMVSQACDIAENQISRLLKNHFQLSFLQYLNMIRITEAKRLLLESDLRIFEIALITGFNSMPHFTRSFKNKEQTTPREFRKLR